MVKNLFSFSDCGLSFAYSGPDGKLKLWDTASGVLKQEYVPNLHLNSPCTACVWISGNTNHGSPVKNKKRKVEVSRDLLALGTSQGSVAIYSLSEGKVVSTLNTDSSQPISCLCWARNVGLYSSSGKEVTFWDINKKKVKSKWKCGKGKITSLGVSDDGEFLVTGSYSLSLWRVSGSEISLVRTYTGHSSDVTTTIFVNSQYFLSSASEDRHISAWSTKTDGEEPLARFVLGEVVQGEISIFESDGTVHLAVATKDGTLHFFKHQLNGKTGKVVKAHENIEIATEGSNPNVIPIVSSKLSSESSASIAYGHPPFLNFELVVLSKKDKKVSGPLRTCLVRSGKQVAKGQSEGGSKVVGGGDERGEYLTNGLRRRVGGEVAMEDRLGNLSLGLPVISDKLSPHNFSNLLIQGLESKDKSLLESVLFQTDHNVISETLSKLPVSALPPLISHLTHMIQGKTLASVRGCMWLKGVMRQHSGQLLASGGSSSSSLASLQSLIESRLTVLGPLMSLSGRLEHILSQLETPQDQTLNNEQAVIIYHDDPDSDDDGENLMIDGEDPSESEDKWDELTDDQLDTETS